MTDRGPVDPKSLLNYADPETNTATLPTASIDRTRPSSPRRKWIVFWVVVLGFIVFSTAEWEFLDAVDHTVSTPRFTIFDIKNDSGRRIDDFTLSGPDGPHKLGAIEIGKTASITLETQLQFSYQYVLTAGGTSNTGHVGFDSDMRGNDPHYDLTIFLMDGQFKVE